MVLTHLCLPGSSVIVRIGLTLGVSALELLRYVTLQYKADPPPHTLGVSTLELSDTLHYQAAPPSDRWL